MSSACEASIWSDILVATGLFVLLMPGFFLNVPSVSKKRMEGESWAKRTFFTGRVTPASILVHSLLYLGLFVMYRYLKAAYWDRCL